MVEQGASTGRDRENAVGREWFEDASFSYLKRHYVDAQKLKARTMEEFARAARTGRLIAFTGSMTTVDRGYLKWNAFAEKCFVYASRSVERVRRKGVLKNTAVLHSSRDILRTFEQALQDRTFDKRVSFSIIGEIMDIVARYSEEEAINLNKQIADELFLKRPAQVPSGTVLANLFAHLNIERLVTLNYDFEAELEIAARSLARPGKALQLLREAAQVEEEMATRTLVARLPGGQSMASDVFLRERTDRLIEFAIGSAEHEYHVLHLHGRADDYASMVVSYRDYDRLYRRSGTSKVPFEHALNLLYTGNPILFVGIGMSETEVNQALQDVVGNHPYRRIMPSFLLWNAPGGDTPAARAAAKDVRRIDMLHRLGVLTLFDDDIAQAAGAAEPAADASSETRLAQAIRNLATAIERGERERVEPFSHWRTMASRVLPGAKTNAVTATWALANLTPSPAAGPALYDEIEASPALLTLLVGTSGLRKGMAAVQFARDYKQRHPHASVVHINADYCFDTDSMLNLIAEMLWHRQGKPGARNVSRSVQFSKPDAFALPDDVPLLFVISGTERLFGNGGEPLSAEFDEAMRYFVASCAANGEGHHARFVVTGTSRVENYVLGLLAPPAFQAPDKKICARIFARVDPGTQSGSSSTAAHTRRNFYYLDSHIQLGMAKAPDATLLALRVAQKAGPNVAIADYRRAYFAANLTPAVLEAAGLDAGLALDILMIMSFIGQPIEAEVLIHAPRLRKRLRDAPDGFEGGVNQVCAQIEKMCAVGLIIPIVPHPAYPGMARYGLHATLLAELRDRSGVPLSEAVLSTAFNMSLYAAQPTDGPLPEPFLHNELGQLIDWLIGAYKDPAPNAGCKVAGSQRLRPDALAALRAALAVIRGFYSTSALLSIERDGAVALQGERDGALTEHGERLDRLLAAFVSAQRKIMAAGDDAAIGPLYADEVVWLYNERGVVKLAQGDLYEARAAFEEADRINRAHVEFDDHSHNWRRITLNQILVDIERGRLSSARDRIDLIERDIGGTKIERIVKLTREPVHGTLGTDSVVSHEELLSIGLTSGYRGLCAHIVGNMVDAQKYFERAMTILHALNESRAYAIFERHRASLGPSILGARRANEALELAIATAEAAHQMDIVHQGRIRRADWRIEDGDLSRIAEWNRYLNDALTYADVTDMYRVRVEARRGLARVRLKSGDFEVALEHAMDAMATATRYGLSLRKIDLRILIGEIMMCRGDPLAGKALIDTAIEESGRIGYQLAMASGRQALSAYCTNRRT